MKEVFLNLKNIMYFKHMSIVWRREQFDLRNWNVQGQEDNQGNMAKQEGYVSHFYYST